MLGCVPASALPNNVQWHRIKCDACHEQTPSAIAIVDEFGP